MGTVTIEVEAMALLLSRRVLKVEQVKLYKKVRDNQEGVPQEIEVRYICEDFEVFTCQAIQSTGWIVRYPKTVWTKDKTEVTDVTSQEKEGEEKK